MASNRGYYIEWLIEHTDYDENYIRNLKDNTLFNMYNRISQVIPKFIKQILNDQENNTYNIMYTEEQLSEKTYNFLNEIRHQRGIAKRKTPKKVRITNNQEKYHKNEDEYEYNDEREIQIITQEEALELFGSDAELLSDKEYRELGYKLECSEFFRLSDEEVELKLEMISFIHKIWGVDSHNMDEFENLNALTFEKVKKIYIKLSQDKRNHLKSYEELKLRIERRY